MRQTATNEKIDPLIRIQEEIKEVARREEEYRQLTLGHSTTTSCEYDTNGNEENSIDGEGQESNSNNNSISISSVSLPSNMAIQQSIHDDNPSNASSLALSVNSKEGFDGHHSDDSGISASSSPINGTSNNAIANGNGNGNETKTPTLPGIKEQRYIGPNCYNLTPEPPQQMLLRAVSTPHLSTTKPRQFQSLPKGLMQTFYATRGKLNINASNPSNASNKLYLNSKIAVALLDATQSDASTPPNTPITPISAVLITDTDGTNTAAAAIPTDDQGKPIRPHFVPVEVKIQRELQDLKTREHELKKIRKTQRNRPDLLTSLDNDEVDTDEEEEEIEHCFGPAKLRSSKSIGELCDSMQFHNSISPSVTPSPDLMKCNRSGGMRPAMSLAELCDLSPEDAPSSHRLIEKWESIIKQNA